MTNPSPSSLEDYEVYHEDKIEILEPQNTHLVICQNWKCGYTTTASNLDEMDRAIKQHVEYTMSYTHGAHYHYAVIGCQSYKAVVRSLN